MRMGGPIPLGYDVENKRLVVNQVEAARVDLRAGSSATERGTRSRSLRGTTLARPSSSRAHDNDRLRLPPASPSLKSEAEKKNQRTTASTKLASHAPCDRQTHPSTATSAMPVLPKADRRRTAA